MMMLLLLLAHAKAAKVEVRHLEQAGHILRHAHRRILPELVRHVRGVHILDGEGAADLGDTQELRGGGVEVVLRLHLGLLGAGPRAVAVHAHRILAHRRKGGEAVAAAIAVNGAHHGAAIHAIHAGRAVLHPVVHQLRRRRRDAAAVPPRHLLLWCAVGERCRCLALARRHLLLDDRLVLALQADAQANKEETGVLRRELVRVVDGDVTVSAQHRPLVHAYTVSRGILTDIAHMWLLRL
mmetsp:Transcript_22813/g.57512  ORF Transcript_22813/g.57512 Transcript_22813/m.57512 type:complete len:239 (+) Transcript_22813:426-1142(+)